MDGKISRRLRVPEEEEEWATQVPFPAEVQGHAEGEGQDEEENEPGGETRKYIFWRNLGRKSLMVVLFLAPLLFLPFTQFPVEASKLTIICGLLVIPLVSFFGCVMEKRSIEYPRSLLGFSIGLFTLIVGLSALFSSSRTLSIYGKLVQPDSLLATLAYAAAFFLSFYFFTKEDVPRILRTVLISLSIATAFGIAQLYGVYLLPWAFTKATAFNTLGTTFGLGVFMVCVVIAAVTRPKERRSTGFTSGAILAAIGLIIINFQFLWIALTLVLLAIAGMRFMARTPFQFPLVLAAIALFFAIIGNHLPTGAATITEVRPNLQSTAAVAGNALHGARVFFGSGPSTFSEQFARFRPQGLNLTNFWNVPFSEGYNFFLTLLTTTGIFGVLAFLLILLGLIGLIRRLPRGSGLVLPILFMVAMLFFYPGFFTLMLLLFIGFALLLSFDESARGEITFGALRRPALFMVFMVAIAGGVLSLIGGYRVIEKYVAMGQYADAVTAFGAGDVPRAAAKIQSSISLDNTSDDAWRAGSQIAFAQGKQAFQGAQNTLNAQAQAAIGTALTAAQNAVKIDPNSVYNWQTLAGLYEGLIPIANGADALAITAYQNAQKIDPWNPDLPLGIARVEVAMAAKLAAAGQKEAAQAKFNEAELQLQQSVTLKQNYATPRFLLAQLYIQEGNVDKAIQRVQEIEQQNPLDAGLAFQLGLLYYQNNQIDKAQQEFARAVTLNKDYTNARYFLGLIDDQKGNHADALQQFTIIQQLNPDNAEVKKILENLNSGKPALSNISPPDTSPVKRSDVPVH